MGLVNDCGAFKVARRMFGDPQRGPRLSAYKWIFCALHFCEDCLLAALTVSAVPAVIDEPGGTLHPPGRGGRKREGGAAGREGELLLHHFS